MKKTIVSLSSTCEVHHLIVDEIMLRLSAIIWHVENILESKHALNDGGKVFWSIEMIGAGSANCSIWTTRDCRVPQMAFSSGGYLVIQDLPRHNAVSEVKFHLSNTPPSIGFQGGVESLIILDKDYSYTTAKVIIERLNRL